jgi:hypothetical protein
MYYCSQSKCQLQNHINSGDVLAPIGVDGEMSKASLRDDLIGGLVKDLHGPQGGPSETFVKPLPSQRYIVGILYPSGSGIEAEQNEESAEEADSADEDEVAGARTPIHDAFLPSSMGMSFMVEAKQEKLEATVSWATYEQSAKMETFKRKEAARKVAIDLKKKFDEIKLDAGKEFYFVHKVTDVPGKDLVHVSVFIVNKEKTPMNGTKVKQPDRDKLCIFTPRITLEDKNRPFLARESTLDSTGDEELRSLRVLYSSRHEFAVGHGCSVAWKDVVDSRCRLVETTFVPIFYHPMVDFQSKKYGLYMRLLSSRDEKKQTLEKIDALLHDYEIWCGKAFSTEVMGKFSSNLKPAVEAHKNACSETLARMRAGRNALETDPIAFEAFCFMNDAMLIQRVQHNAALDCRKSGTYEEPDYGTISLNAHPEWRPFQLAFILQSLPEILDSNNKYRKIVDLLWIPTGGGKTEAYLGLAAFAIAVRRLRSATNYIKYAGVSVIMRYTLRLLTIQQFERAVLLASACEYLRDKDVLRYGTEPILVGLFVGRTTTPNAIGSENDYAKSTSSSNRSVDNKNSAWYALGYWRAQGKKPPEANPFQLKYCPWCGYELPVDSYEIKDKCLHVHCVRKGCPFNAKLEIPAVTVDEEIYSRLPAIVVSTVDKFANMPFNPKIATLFGRADGFCQACNRHMLVGVDAESEPAKHAHRDGGLLRVALNPPELIIQDELHLINGPLGSMVGIYETSVEYFASRKVGDKDVVPKYVASTATTRRARDQLWNLCVREVRRFPPPVTDYSNSFFVREIEDNSSAKVYLGLFPSGISQKTAMIRTLSHLLTALADAKKKGGPIDEWDEYWTSVMYFNSIRELGSAVTTVEDDVQNRVDRKVRNLSVEELTSRMGSTELPEILDRLDRTGNSKGSIDVLACSNMFSVGVDVQRLGLMIMNNQPKAVSEYIQSTGRVGRRGTGLVIVLYNWTRPRDQSHFERFQDFHNRIQYHVEAMTVTPFSTGALDRAAHAQYVSLVRVVNKNLSKNSAAGNFDSKVRANPMNKALEDVLGARMARIGNPVAGDAQSTLSGFLDTWQDATLMRSLNYKRDTFHPRPILMAQDKEEVKMEAGPRVLTPISLRNVELEVNIHKMRGLRC